MEYIINFSPASRATPQSAQEMGVLSARITAREVGPLLAAAHRQAARLDLPQQEHTCAVLARDELSQLHKEFAVDEEAAVILAGASKGVMQAVADILLSPDDLVHLPDEDVAVLREAHQAADVLYNTAF